MDVSIDPTRLIPPATSFGQTGVASHIAVLDAALISGLCPDMMIERLLVRLERTPS